MFKLYIQIKINTAIIITNNKVTYIKIIIVFIHMHSINHGGAMKHLFTQNKNFRILAGWNKVRSNVNINCYFPAIANKIYN